MHRCDIAQELDGGKAAVPHRDHPPSVQPAYGLQQSLPGPVGQLLMPVTSLSGIAFGGRSMVRKGRAHAHPAHGIGASSITHNQRRPLALTKWPWLDRTGSDRSRAP